MLILHLPRLNKFVQIKTFLNQIAREQQRTLICAGLPLFKCTDKESEVRVQMALIQFILSIGSIYKEADI